MNDDSENPFNNHKKFRGKNIKPSLYTLGNLRGDLPKPRTPKAIYIHSKRESLPTEGDRSLKHDSIQRENW